MSNKPPRRPSNFDVCKCGDYRHQHKDGHGPCVFNDKGGHCIPDKKLNVCKAFRLNEVATKGVFEDLVSEYGP